MRLRSAACCALASSDIFAEDETGRFQLTPMAATLQTQVPGSLRAMAILWGEPGTGRYGQLLARVQTGEIPWPHSTGRDLFASLASNPEHAGQFDAAMTAFSGQEPAAVAGVYDFAPIRTLMDVAGGQGLFRAAPRD